MKINQLFKRHVKDCDAIAIIQCFDLVDFEDRRMFCKKDLVHIHAVSRLEELVPMLRTYYLPCKARVYLENLCENRAVTILKQVLRLFRFALVSREKNINGRKVIFYQVQSEGELLVQRQMKKSEVCTTLSFS